MSYITESLTAEVERVAHRGTPDKVTVNKFAAIMWELEKRITVLEAELAKVTAEAATAKSVEATTEEVKRGRGRPPKDTSGKDEADVPA